MRNNILVNWVCNLYSRVKSKETIPSKYLQVLYCVIVADMLFLLQEWYKFPVLLKESVQNINYLCPPYFTNCGLAYIFTNSAPYYSYKLLIAFVALFIFFSIFLFLKQNYKLAILLLLIPVIFKFLVLYFLNYDTVLNYNYLTLLLAVVFIFAKDKIFAMKVIVTFMYFSSAFIKIYPSYLAGDFLDTLNGGFPLLPEMFNSFYAIFLVMLFLIGPIFLWSKNKLYRLASFSLLLIFHLYSVILVGFRFPFVCIMLLYIFYLSEHDKFELKKIFRNKLLTFLIIIMITLQVLPYFIKGNHRITAEAEKYGYYIFNTNKQCIINTTIIYKDGTKKELNASSTNPIQRCDPYRDWFILNKTCDSNQNISSIKLRYYVSLNGSYYHKVVDTNDICKLKYSIFKHNEWIKDDILDKTIPVYKNSL